MARYKLTNATVVAGGQPANLSLILSPAGSAFINAPSVFVDSASVALGVTLAAGANDAAGNMTVNVTVPSSVSSGTAISVQATDSTAAGLVTATPFILTVTSVVPPPSGEPTALSFTQNS
jgi:hypothetical protein